MEKKLIQIRKEDAEKLKKLKKEIGLPVYKIIEIAVKDIETKLKKLNLM